MKRQTLVNGLIAITAVSVATGCVDDKYDLSDIDTTSRFTVNDLTVPVNLSEIRLENVVDLDDNDLIEKVIIDGKECYAIKQSGEIAPTEFKIDKVNVSVPTINPTDFTINLPTLPVVPGIYIQDLKLGTFDIDTSKLNLVDYSFDMKNIHEALLALKDVTTTPIQVTVELTVPDVLVGGDNEISFKNLKLQLPWGLRNVTGAQYNDKNGEATFLEDITVDRNGKAVLQISAEGLVLGDKGNITNHELNINGQVGVLDGALDITVKNFTFQSVPTALKIGVNYNVSSFTVEKFSGSVDYNMDAIHIDPISLNDLPDFLNNPQTNIVIANPQILVSIKNPVSDWLAGKGKITLKSNFRNGEKSYPSGEFTLSQYNTISNFAFCTPKDGYTTVPFDGLRDVLSNGDSGLPTSIEVNIEDINFKNTEVEDFPLGDLGTAEGSYEFNAPLGFGNGSVVVYETTEDGWGSDDLDDVNINKIHLKANCTTNLPVSIHLTIIPVDKNGKEIAIKEDNRYFDVPAMAQNEPIILNIESVNGPIKNFDGVKFIATVRQDGDNTEAIGPDLNIVLKDLRVTVDGYYETDF